MAALTAMLTFSSRLTSRRRTDSTEVHFMRCSGRTSPGLPVPLHSCGRVSRDACPRWLARVGEYFDVFPNVGMAEGFQDCQARKPVCTGPQKDSGSCSSNTQRDYLRGVL